MGVGVSPMATFVYGPHAMRLIPLPSVPNPPQRWDAKKCHSEVVLSQYDLLATNHASSGYPTVVGTQTLRHGVHYFEVTVEYLPASSFMLIGVTGGPAHQANERVPGGEFHCWGYGSSGEIWAHGARVQGGREEFVSGDTFGILIDLDNGTLTFFRNDYPVGLFCALSLPLSLSLYLSLSVCVCARACVRACVRVCVRARSRACVCLCVCKYIYTHTHRALHRAGWPRHSRRRATVLHVWLHQLCRAHQLLCPCA